MSKNAEFGLTDTSGDHHAGETLSLADAARSMHAFLTALWPLYRTANSDDLERAIEMCGEYLDDPRYEVHRFEPKTDVMTWWVPERYHVREAWLEVDGERIADFAENPLHLLSYSLPHEIDGKLGDIRDHIWSNPKRPNAIPWEFKYYERSWGFCVRHNDLERFSDESEVRGVIDVEFGDESLCVGEIFLKGESSDELLFLTNVCHPMQVNDSVAGLVVALEMAKILAKKENRRYGIRVLAVPEVIGTIAWFDRFRDKARNIKYAWFCEMVGNDAPFNLQRSRQSDSLIDRAFLTVLRSHRRHGEEKSGAFRWVVASDEIVTNGPGFDIPTPSLTRWPYDEYHTSDDNPSIVRPDNLAEALAVCLGVWESIEDNYYPVRQFEGPVMLSRYDLWVDWRIDWDLNLKTEAIMLNLEGYKSVIDIAYEVELPFNTVKTYLDRFHAAGLIRKSTTPTTVDDIMKKQV